MAAKDLQKKSKSPQKRKGNSDATARSGDAMSKRPKLAAGTKPSPKPPSKDSKKKPFKQFKSNVGDDKDKKAFGGKKPYSKKPDSKDSTKKPFKKVKSNDGDENKAPMTKLERRKHAKELADARKMRRKHYYDIEQELARLSEKIRIRKRKEDDKTKFAEERSKLVGEAMQKVKGKIHEIACSHVCSRVLQYCVKYGSQAERNAMLEEILPHLFSLSTKTYAAFLIRKMLKYASKKQLATVISAFHGHVAALLRHKEGSVVIERAYQLGNAAQKHALLIESYSPELQIFKDLVTTKESRLTDIMSKLNLPKASVTRHMTSVIQPILEKGLVKHSIIHRVLIEYLSIADKTFALDVIQQLSGTLLVKMIKTKDGSKIGMLCVKLGSAKERKKIVKGLKGRVQKIAEDQFGSMVLVEILSIVDDTKLVSKIIINELKEITNTLVLNKFGRRLFLQLLNPNSPRYFSPDYLVSFDLSVPSLSSKGEESNEDKTESEGNRSSDPGESHDIVEGGKKDPLVRRQELLVKSGLAEKLIDVCIEDAGKLLRSNIGKDMIYEVVTGAADGILNSALEEKLNALNVAIASLASEPKPEGSKDEHVLENFHSSWVIRKLILDCPTFATALWNGALNESCEIWAAGHSSKVLTAYLASSDPKVNKLASKKLQGLIDRGLLKIPEKKSIATTKA